MSEQPSQGSRSGQVGFGRLLSVFEGSRHPMLIADDQRRWVTGNASASQLLGIAREEVPWRAMDDFTPASERRRLEKEWESFLTNGEAEGWYQLYVPSRGSVPVEFSAIANVQPARHLAVFILPELAEQERAPIFEPAWTSVARDDQERVPLTKREREVTTLVAAGLTSSDVGERLFLSTETVKSHIRNAMRKLGAHTRAHAVAIALATGQIVLDE